MLARNLLVAIERKVDDAPVAAAANADFVLGDEIDLRTRVVLVANLGVDALADDTVGRVRSLIESLGMHAGLASQQGRANTMESGARCLGEFGVDLDIAQRYAPIV